MGGGAPRELEANTGPARPLSAEDDAKIAAALEVLDARNEDFRQGREDEKIMQLSKAWASKVIAIVGDLRQINKAIIAKHQLALDTGSNGGGLGARPYVEEVSNAFPMLEFRLEDDTIHACYGDEENPTSIAKVNIERIDYDICEKIVVAWVVHAIKNSG